MTLKQAVVVHPEDYLVETPSLRMDFKLSEEQKLLRETVREFSEKEISPRIGDMIRKRKIPEEIKNGMAKLGLLGMTVPEEYGGMGADALTTGIVAEEIGRADPTASIPVLFLVDNAWSYLISKYGTSKLKENLLPDVAKGKKIVGIASTEPNFGSDLSSMTSRATKVNGGFILSGEKAFISLVRDIDETGGGFVTVFKTDPAKGTDGISLIFMPYDRKQMETMFIEEMGREGSSWGSFKFSDLQVGDDHLIGEINRGFRIVHEGFEFARGLISMISCGAASKSLENGAEYMKQRRAFGREIARFQGLQFDLAQDVAKIEAARNTSMKALWMYDMEQNGKMFTRFDVSKEIAIAKFIATTWAFDAINDALQWQGAYGYSKDCPEEWALRGIRSFQLAEGSREIMKLIIARETLGKEYLR